VRAVAGARTVAWGDGLVRVVTKAPVTSLEYRGCGGRGATSDGWWCDEEAVGRTVGEASGAEVQSSRDDRGSRRRKKSSGSEVSPRVESIVVY
jgi:hypothetical protein